MSKPRALLSGASNRILLTCSIITLIGFLAVVVVSLTYDGPTVIFGPSKSASISFYVIFAMAAVDVIAQFALWVTMLWFTLSLARVSLGKRLALLMLQLAFLSVGSAIVYFTEYQSRIRVLEKTALFDTN
jgi:hypothetical protein